MTTEKKQEYLIISLFPFTMLVYSLFSSPFSDLLKGLRNILLSNGILLTDYYIVGGRSAAIFNASFIALINIFILYVMNMKINGLLISGIYLIFGFSFMGKNILNIIPFYFGAYAYAKISRKEFKSVIVVCMFSTCLSPIVSSLARAFGFSPLGLVIAAITGFSLGFIVPPVSAHVLLFHNGYSLYNTGLAAGLISIVFYSILEAAGLDVNPNKVFYEHMDYHVLAILIGVFLFYIAYGYWTNNKSFRGLKELHSHPGRLVSDFIVTEGFPVVMINMGILGLFSLLLIFMLFPFINGLILSGLLAVLAFSGFGKHIKNISPVIFGVWLAYLLFGREVATSSFAITLFFSTCLAPISGKFGFLAGIAVGFANFCLVLNMGAMHGGLNLYNTGLSAGIVASISVPILQIFKEV